uniref:ATP synthase F0 subunit 8 n=1 Tax=Mandarinia regalis TaxID=2847581 RepID=UPI00226C8A29|nr:ATP synthase F0 subunit 8 [Mandarinia regalis]UZP46667.1 ATP synthase F0 subunit 8 [Mandarinia regalis]
MPQMMPINWMFSFILFISIFLMFNIINYYTFNYSPNFKNLSNFLPPKNNLIWKW